MTHYDDLLQEGHKLIAEQHADILTDLQRQGEIIERQAETIRQQQEEIELWTKRTNVLWHKSLERGDRIEELEAENAGLKKAVDSLHKSVAHREAHNIYLTEQHAQAIREKDERIAELEAALRTTTRYTLARYDACAKRAAKDTRYLKGADKIYADWKWAMKILKGGE